LRTGEEAKKEEEAERGREERKMQKEMDKGCRVVVVVVVGKTGREKRRQHGILHTFDIRRSTFVVVVVVVADPECFFGGGRRGAHLRYHYHGTSLTKLLLL
jgi:hypothetical protein